MIIARAVNGDLTLAYWVATGNEAGDVVQSAAVYTGKSRRCWGIPELIK